MSNPFSPFLLRIRSQDGDIIGTGFLVSARHVLTCAHVIADAHPAGDRYASVKPTYLVNLDFPLPCPSRPLPARVVHWVPMSSADGQQPKGDEDVALLEILDEIPAEYEAGTLAATDVGNGLAVQTFGFSQARGIPTEGMTKDAISEGCVVLEAAAAKRQFIEAGFSGAPVCHTATIIGMIVRADEEKKTAYMIPASLLRRYVEKARALEQKRPGACKNIPRHSLPYLCDRSAQERALSKALRQHLDEKRQRPIVCLIHGDEKEDYTGFLQRLKMRVFPKHLRLEERGLAIKEEGMSAPSSVTTPADFWESLSRALLGYGGGLPDEIRAAAASHTEPLMLKLHLDTESFKQSGEPLFEHLFSFWQEWPTLTSGRVLINCVCLSYKRYENFGLLDFASRRQRKLNEQLKAWLKNFDGAAYPKVTGVALPELHAITRTEVLEWVDDEEVRNACEIYPSKVQKLFQRRDLCNRDGHIHSEDLYPELIHLLKAEQ